MSHFCLAMNQKNLTNQIRDFLVCVPDHLLKCWTWYPFETLIYAKQTLLRRRNGINKYFLFKK